MEDPALSPDAAKAPVEEAEEYEPEESDYSDSDDFEDDDDDDSFEASPKPRAKKPAPKKRPDAKPPPPKRAKLAPARSPKPVAAALSEATGTSEGAESPVLKYLTTVNRPYNVTAIFENLLREVPLAQLKRELEDGVRRGRLEEAGDASKVYFCNQAHMPEPNPEETALLDSEILVMAKSTEDAAARGLQCASDVARLAAEPVDGELDAALETTTQELEGMKASLARLMEAQKNEPTEDFSLLREQLKFYTRSVKDLRSNVMSVVGDISSASGARVPDLLETMGVDST